MRARINNQSFVHFTEFEIDSVLDSVASTFSLSAFFNLDNPEHKEIFRPLSYHKIELFDDDESLMLTGTILVHDFDDSAESAAVQLSGYSLPGIIEDCNVPYSMYPLESLKMNLGEIARKLIAPFGLNLVIHKSVQNDVNLVYSKSVCKPEDSIKDYLSKLAAQRNIVLSHDERGNLLMFRPDIASKSKILFTSQNTTSMALSVNGQDMHNQLTILRQPGMKKKKTTKEKSVKQPAQLDSNGYPITPPKIVKKIVTERPKPQFFDTLKNPMIKAFRPAVRKMTEGEDVSTESAVRNYMADELRNISFIIILNRKEDLKVGDIIEVQSNRIFLQNKTRLMISGVSKEISADGIQMTINAVLPETFSGTEPKNIFI